MSYSSKELQILKQISGRSYQIFLMLMATFAGTWATGVTPVSWMIITAAIALILQTISSQLDYIQMKAIMKEQLIRFHHG